jgi:tetratricopeptide (TPR) repeat protein
VNGPGYRTAHLDELERFDGEAVTIPVRIPLGIGSFGINAYAGREVGGQVIEDHDELGAGAGHHEELYVVVTGRATFTVDGETIDAAPGTLVFLDDPKERRGAIAVEDGTTVLAIGGVRGKPFQISPWEFSFRTVPLFSAKRYAEAKAVLLEGLELHPGNANLLYDLACVEALAGEREEALEHLATAVTTNPKFGEYAQTDGDLDSIRDDPRFPSAVPG